MDKTALVLASASPLREKLLARMGLPFTIHPQEVDETFRSTHPRSEARRIARLKVESLLTAHPREEEHWILGADTFIIRGRLLLGKPKTREDARRMLRHLEGRRHRVITGMALHIPNGGIRTWTAVTSVKFRSLTDQDLEWYLDRGEWRGAAGAYRIQGTGACLVHKIIGTSSNVMGLPIETLYGILRQYGFSFQGEPGDIESPKAAVQGELP